LAKIKGLDSKPRPGNFCVVMGLGPSLRGIAQPPHELLLRFNSLGLDHHKLAHRSLVDELNPAGDLGEKSVIFAASNVQSRLNPCAMIVPPGTSCPPKALKPSRCAFESRPFREVPCPFLCAINQFPILSGQLPVDHYFFFFFAAFFLGAAFFACGWATCFVAFFPGRFERFTTV
jgi:hypothetical protein